MGPICASPRGVGMSLAGEPPSYVANCPGGYYFNRFSMPGTMGANLSDSTGPFIEVDGAASPGANGIYAPVVSAPNFTAIQQAADGHYWEKGSWALLWERGPRLAVGHRWLLLGPNASTDAPLYLKHSSDGAVGWRSGSSGAWLLGSGVAPAPTVDGEEPEVALTVHGAGQNGIDGKYERVASAPYPASYKRYKKGSFELIWEGRGRIDVGLRWVLWDTADQKRGSSQDEPHYFRLSADSDLGYFGTWTVGSGIYPPPRVTLFQAVSCLRCPPGSFSSPDSESCQRCPAGSFSLGAADNCTICEAGTAADCESPRATFRKLPSCDMPHIAAGKGVCTVALLGASSCTACEAGQYSPAGAGACIPCPPGTRSGTARAGTCMACEAGKYSGLGHPQCIPCPAGRHGPQSAAGSPLACLHCEPGRFTATPSATLCEECSPGRYASSIGASICQDCPPGSYSSEAGADICTLCPTKLGGAGRSECYGQIWSASNQTNQSA